MTLHKFANGDLERTFKALAPKNSHTEERIAAMLGFMQEDAKVPTTTKRVAPPESLMDDAGEELVTEEKDAERAEIADSPVELPIELRQIKAAVAATTPDWLTDITPLEETDNGRAQKFLEPLSLFPPERKRSILTMALSSLSAQGSIMIDPLVEAIARGQALRSLPHAVILSMARGMQLLVDRSEAMMPLLADLDQIEEDIQGVFGKMYDYFRDHVPGRGTRVICVTDLGLARPTGGPAPAQPEEWLQFQTRLRKYGCPLLVLTPYSSSRWPPRLAKRLNILHWDRKVNAARVSVLIKRNL